MMSDLITERIAFPITRLTTSPMPIGRTPGFLSRAMSLEETSTGALVKFHQKWLRENSPFLLHFLMHIHVLMLYKKFELIPT